MENFQRYLQAEMGWLLNIHEGACSHAALRTSNAWIDYSSPAACTLCLEPENNTQPEMMG